MQDFKTIESTPTYKNDNNSCTVVASAVAFDVDYKDMTDYYASKGRRRGRGIDYDYAIELVNTLASEYNYKYKRMNKTDIIKLTKGKTMTVNNCTNYLDKNKNYVMFSRGHAIGVAGGKVQDWSAGSKRPVVDLIELTPPADKVFDGRKLLIQQEEALLNRARELLCK